MRSAGYEHTTCIYCRDHRWSEGINIGTPGIPESMTDWVEKRWKGSSLLKRLKGTCKGCINVAGIHMLVIAAFLYRLEVFSVEEG